MSNGPQTLRHVQLLAALIRGDNAPPSGVTTDTRWPSDRAFNSFRDWCDPKLHVS